MLKVAAVALLFTCAPAWADLPYQIQVLIPYQRGATIYTAVALNNTGAILWQMAGGGGDDGLLLWGAGEGGGSLFPIPMSTDSGIITPVLRFDAPWADTTTFGIGLNDSGDTLFRAVSSWSPSFTPTGYGVVRSNGTVIADTTGTSFADWGGAPFRAHLNNDKGQFVGLVPDARFPQENDWALFTPVPEPTSLLLLTTLTLPALIRLRRKRT